MTFSTEISRILTELESNAKSINVFDVIINEKLNAIDENESLKSWTSNTLFRRNLFEKKASNDIDEIDEIDVSNLNWREIEKELESLNSKLITIWHLIRKL